MDRAAAYKWLEVYGDGKPYALFGHVEIIDNSIVSTHFSPFEISSRSTTFIDSVPTGISLATAGRIMNNSSTKYETQSVMAYFIIIKKESEFSSATSPVTGATTIKRIIQNYSEGPKIFKNFQINSTLSKQETHIFIENMENVRKDRFETEKNNIVEHFKAIILKMQIEIDHKKQEISAFHKKVADLHQEILGLKDKIVDALERIDQLNKEKDSSYREIIEQKERNSKLTELLKRRSFSWASFVIGLILMLILVIFIGIFADLSKR